MPLWKGQFGKTRIQSMSFKTKGPPLLNKLNVQVHPQRTNKNTNKKKEKQV